MNRLVIIGNGFDLAHGLKTRYKDFINWYWGQRIFELCEVHSHTTEDILCKLEPRSDDNVWNNHIIMQNIAKMCNDKNFERFKQELAKDEELFYVSKSLLFDRITKSLETKGWVDIENDYYALLKENSNNIVVCEGLNKQLDFLRTKLSEYLTTQKANQPIEGIKDIISAGVAQIDCARSSMEIIKDAVRNNIVTVNENKTYEVEDVMLLSFNYTDTSKMYENDTVFTNHIHGSLNDPDKIIFGYGDELDKDYQYLIEKNENELIKYSKSIRYLETKQYQYMLNFIESGLFQVYIMGHSCGNSDRTLLNTIFEHDNCVSIKPFCFFDENGKDNYWELVQNMYRNFTDKKLYRGRVVNKTQCTTLDGQPLVRKKIN